jgi:MerR family redox-sensitive transcriptional activator SoxR
LPRDQAPSAKDCQAIGLRIQDALAVKITLLEKTHALLGGCIGCGCLSLDRCALYNPNDRAARAVPGARFLLGDKASDFVDD